MSRSIARKLLLTVTLLCATTWLAQPVAAGVGNKNFGVKVSRSKKSFDDCFYFGGGNQFRSSVGLGGTWSEFDLFLFGFWSFRASNDIRFTGTHVLGFWIIGGGTNTLGERFFASGFQGCFFGPQMPGHDDVLYTSSVTLAQRAREFDPRLWR